MMKLSKAEIDQRDDHVSALKKAKEEIDDLAEGINESIDDLNEKIAEYNQLLGAAGTFTKEIAQQQSDYIDDKSERWQESDRGQEYSSWKDEWEDYDHEEINDVETISTPSMEHAEKLKELSTEFEG